MYKIINTKKELQELANEMGICPDHCKHLFDFTVIASRSGDIASGVNIYNKYGRRVAVASLIDLFLFACNISEIDQPQSQEFDMPQLTFGCDPETKLVKS